MSERILTDPPPRLVIDFSEPMRPRSRVRVKIVPVAGTPSGNASPGRTKLYESLAKRQADE